MTFTLLVVDDDVEIWTLVHEAFASRTCRVLAVGSTRAAEQVMSTRRVDALLVDVHLTDVREAEGIWWVANLRSRGARHPIAIITSDRTQAPGRTRTALGIQAVFYKPFSLDQVCAWLIEQGWQPEAEEGVPLPTLPRVAELAAW